MEDFIAVLAWLGGACFCGILPLGFATILFFIARKRNQVGSTVADTRQIPISALQTGSGQVRLQGKIAPLQKPLDGSSENALVYLRLKVEQYESDEDSSGWRSLVDKARGTPFQLEDGTGSIWVIPESLDKQLLGDGFIPAEDQVQVASILLGISLKIYAGQLRYRMWEFRAGQEIAIVGMLGQGPQGLTIGKAQGRPFIISPILGQALDATISTQSKRARTWMLVLGIPGALFLLCGLGGAIVSLIRVFIAR